MKPNPLPDFVSCPHCAGRGVYKLTGIYAETLKGLRRLSARPEGYAVANMHAGWFGCNPTALNNRLRWLEEHGFATSEQYGRQRRYRSVSPRKGTP